MVAIFSAVQAPVVGELTKVNREEAVGTLFTRPGPPSVELRDEVRCTKALQRSLKAKRLSEHTAVEENNMVGRQCCQRQQCAESDNGGG